MSLRSMKMSLVAALLGVWLCAGAAQAQNVTIGVVDEDKLAESYTKYMEAVAALDKRAQEVDQQLASRELLNETEAKRFDDLIVKADRNAAENTELQNIIKAGADRRADYIGLMGKATRTDAEKARVQAIEEDAKRNATGLRRISDAIYNKLRQDQAGIDKQYTDQANNVIAQVAADKKLTLVVRKSSVIWNAPSMDITDEVIARLNKA